LSPARVEEGQRHLERVLEAVRLVVGLQQAARLGDPAVAQLLVDRHAEAGQREPAPVPHGAARAASGVVGRHHHHAAGDARRREHRAGDAAGVDVAGVRRHHREVTLGL
jgi:hypothetical protein